MGPPSPCKRAAPLAAARPPALGGAGRRPQPQAYRPGAARGRCSDRPPPRAHCRAVGEIEGGEVREERGRVRVRPRHARDRER